MSQLIAKRYAKALLGSAKNAKDVEHFYESVKIIRMATIESEDFRKFVANPVIPYDVQLKILNDLFKNKVHNEILNFLMFIIQKRRFNLLNEIVDQFELFYLKERNIVKATIYSTIKLSSDQINSIKEKLILKINKQIDPQMQIDSNLLGGFKVKIDDKIYDYSIRTLLDTFKKAITV